jgi:hypothetical protein
MSLHLVFSPSGERLLKVSGDPAALLFWSPGDAAAGSRQWVHTGSCALRAGLAVLAAAWAPPEHGSLVGALCVSTAAAPRRYALLLLQEEGGAWGVLAEVPVGEEPAAAAGGAAARAAGCLAFAPWHLGLRVACAAGAAGLVRVFQARDPALARAWELREEFVAAPPPPPAAAPHSVTSLCWCPSQGDAPLLAVACAGQARVWGLAPPALPAAGARAPGGQWVAMLELCAAADDAPQTVVAWAPSPGRAEHCLATGSADGRVVFWRMAAGGSPSARAIASAGQVAPGVRARAVGSGAGGLVGCARTLVEGAGAGAIHALQWSAAGSTLAAMEGDRGSVRLFRQELSGEWTSSLVGEEDVP